MAPKKSDAVPSEKWMASMEGLTRDEAEARFPKLAELCKSWGASTEPAVEVTSTVAGFRRGGAAHPIGARAYSFWEFTPDQLEQMLNEPVLHVRLVDAEKAADSEDAGQ